MRLFSHVLFTALACACLYVGASTTIGVFRLIDRPFPGLSIVDEGLINPVGLSSWGGGRAGFQMWDRIVAVDGELVFSRDDIIARALDREVGDSAVYQVRSLSGSERFVELPIMLFRPSDLLSSHTMHAALGLIFIVVAVLLYGLRPATPEAWTFFLFFASLGLVMASVVDMTVLWHLPQIYPVVAPFLGVFGFVLTGVISGAYAKGEGTLLLEGRLEPGEPGFREEQARAEQRTRRQRIQARLVVASIIGFVISAIISVLMLAIGDARLRYAVVDSLFWGWILISTSACFALLIFAYRRGRSPRRRARIRQILWAWPVGAGIPVLNLFCGQVLQLWPMSQTWSAFLLLVPLSTADAIVRHDLLRLNHTARRLVGGLTVASAVGVMLGFVLWGAVTFLRLTDASAMVALAAVLFAVAAPFTHRVQTHIEDLLRQTTYDAGRLAASFSAKASTSNHLGHVVTELQSVLHRSLKPASVEVYRLTDGSLVPLIEAGAAVAVDASIGLALEHSEPLVCDDEQPAPSALGGEDIALIVRLAVAGEPVGVMVVGERSDGRPYEGADVAFVASLAGPLAASLVSTLAFEAVERLNRDLEARVQARTAELAQMNDELAVMNERKDELVASVSHDFRSPLAIIRQNVQTVLRDLPTIDRDDLRMFLQAIARQEDRLTSMCTNLLDLARLKQRGTPEQPVDLRSLVRMIIDGFSSRAGDKGVTLAAIVADGPVLVAGDEDRLGQLVQNLVDNALKFTSSGGTVTIRVGVDDVTPPGSDADYLVLSVEDSGIGLPAAALTRVFEPFFQVPHASFVGQGSGLGLAIVKAVADAHQGRVVVDSQEGRGTRFIVTLPRYFSSEGS